MATVCLLSVSFYICLSALTVFIIAVKEIIFHWCKNVQIKTEHLHFTRPDIPQNKQIQFSIRAMKPGGKVFVVTLKQN